MHEARRLEHPAQPSISLHTVKRVALSQANMWSSRVRTSSKETPRATEA